MGSGAIGLPFAKLGYLSQGRSRHRLQYISSPVLSPPSYTEEETRTEFTLLLATYLAHLDLDDPTRIALL